MNICVCIKQVPDTTQIRIDPETHTLVRAGVPSIVNPYDNYALEAAVRLKEQHGGSVIVLTMGPAQAEQALRDCLAVGADEGYLLTSRRFSGSDTLSTSYILSAAIRRIEELRMETFDLILCGKQAVDGDTAQVGPEIAEHLALPHVTYALGMVEKGGSLRVRREIDGGVAIVETRLPALVTVSKLPVEPRYPDIRSWKKARNAEIHILSEEDLAELDLSLCGLKGSPTRVVSTYVPVREKKGLRLTGDTADETAEKLMELLVRSGRL
ncbi:MAG: electron transfer flavoprotein subunit beta/FixA family protein [Firmicutes bacterium]|nr:electron transfer flavoprotein subunit beta/FixA family protein [Bacillota bacterium]